MDPTKHPEPPAYQSEQQQPMMSQQQPQQYPPQQYPSQQYPSQQYPPQQYPPQPIMMQPMILTGQPSVQVVTVGAPPIAFRDVPLTLQCQFCHATVSTRMEQENGILVWLLVGAICFFGMPLFLFLGCCLIPLCIPSVKDVGHYCPACNRKLGTYQRVH